MRGKFKILIKIISLRKNLNAEKNRDKETNENVFIIHMANIYTNSVFKMIQQANKITISIIGHQK